MSKSTSVDSSLWWDSFTTILSELETLPSSSDVSSHLEMKLRDNHAWFVHTVSFFKPPSSVSREALNSNQVKVGSHDLDIQRELRDKALFTSSYLSLDEVQAYILVERSLKHIDKSVNSTIEEYIHLVLVHYYIERQCLLKCTRQILIHSHHGISSQKDLVRDEALKLISDGLESKLVSVLQDLLSFTHPERMGVDVFILWAEERLLEDNLVLEILFLIYYESLCHCNIEVWKKLCYLYKGMLSGSINLGKLAVSSTAMKYSNHVKIQLLLVLMQTLNLEKFLQLLHDDIPFREDVVIFSLLDIQQMDTLISSFNAFAIGQAGPLMLSWAACVSIISSLPKIDEYNVLMEINHASYACQGINGASLCYFIEILESDVLKACEGPAAGYLTVLRTSISAFIASYEINLQWEDRLLNQILDILCKIYRGQESLCIQFWDRQSFIDGPIRCLLCNLEGEFPYRTEELVRLLSSLGEGCWPAECVYKFLDKFVGISSLIEISSQSTKNISQIVEVPVPLRVHGIDGLLIPAGTRGHVVRVISGNNALVRWEYPQSGVLVLLMRLAHEWCFDRKKEAFFTLDLFCRMVSFNSALCYSLMDGPMLPNVEFGVNEKVPNLWVPEIICAIINKLSPNSESAALMSLGVCILAKLLRCAPSHVAAVVDKLNVFGVAWKSNSSGLSAYDSSSASWLLSGKLSMLISIDLQENDSDSPLVISVLEFTLQLIEKKIEIDLALSLAFFSLQYVLINHVSWKYKVKHVRWKTTMKVMDVLKACILSIPFCEKLGMAVHDMLFADSSIFHFIFSLVCTTKQCLENLYINRQFELAEIEGFEAAVCSALDTLFIFLSKCHKEILLVVPFSQQALQSSPVKMDAAVTSLISLICYFHNPAIQLGAVKVLSMLLVTSDSPPHFFRNICFSAGDPQVAELRQSIRSILMNPREENEILFIALIHFLTDAAYCQPAFFHAICVLKVHEEVHMSNASNMERPCPVDFPMQCRKSCLVDALLHYVDASNDFFNRSPSSMLAVLKFLKVLWQGAIQYVDMIETLKSSQNFLEHLLECVYFAVLMKVGPLEKMKETEAKILATKYHCGCAALEILAHELFFRKKLLLAESCFMEARGSMNANENVASTLQSQNGNDNNLQDMMSSFLKRLSLDNLVKSCTSWKFDSQIYYRAKVASSMFLVHVMEKLLSNMLGNFSVSLIEKIHDASKNLYCQPAFSELLEHYSKGAYSEEKELKRLILSDLYCHLEGELDGHVNAAGPFKDLCQYLLQSKCFLPYLNMYKSNHIAEEKSILLYDLTAMRSDLGLDLWDYTDWQASKEIAEKLLDCLQTVNSMVLLASSKLQVLESFVTVLTVYGYDEKGLSGLKVTEKLCFSCLDHLCQSMRATVESLPPILDIPEEILNHLSLQAKLTHLLLRSVKVDSSSSSACLLVLEASSSAIKMLQDLRSSVAGVALTMKFLVMLFLLAMGCCRRAIDKDSEFFLDVSHVCIDILPSLCSCISSDELYAVSMASIDSILHFIAPKTWLAIIQKHLPLQIVVMNIQHKAIVESILITLRFILSLAKLKDGANLLLRADCLSSLKILFSNVSNSSTSGAAEVSVHHLLLALGFAIIAAMVHFLEEKHSMADQVVPYFVSEKAFLFSNYLSSLDFASSDRKRKPWAQSAPTSLTILKATEQALVLMCCLAEHWRTHLNMVKDCVLHLQEKSVHLLASSSKETHVLGDCSTGKLLLHLLPFCPPAMKEELDWCRKQSSLNCRSGWFAISTVNCKPADNHVFSSSSSTRNSPTYFSDLVAWQIYKIDFLALKFLCLEARAAVLRSEEVGYVDLENIPELPMPDILHGLQDQAMGVVSELCGAKAAMNSEGQWLCIFMLQIMEMALYLELCVAQMCGIRPVLAHVEGFSRGLQLLFKAMDGHDFLITMRDSLREIISHIYPGFSQA